MTKYLGDKFSSPANNKNYSDNYDRIFGKGKALKEGKGICDACCAVVSRDSLKIISTPQLAGVAVCEECS